MTLRYDMLTEFARWAAEGRLDVPIAQTFALEEWDEARELSQSGPAPGQARATPGATATGD